MRYAEFYHALAMEAAYYGSTLRKVGAEESARSKFRSARIYEAAAAAFTTTQPEHAIYCGSAASLALDAGEPHEAAVLAQVGLNGHGVSGEYVPRLRAVLAEAQRQIQAAEAAKGEEP